MYECRCDERLKTKVEGSTRRTYTGLRGDLEHLKIKSDLSIFKVIRSATDLVRISSIFVLRCT